MATNRDGQPLIPDAVVIPAGAPPAVGWDACAMVYAIEVLSFGTEPEQVEADAFLTAARGRLDRAGWRLVSRLTDPIRAWVLELTEATARVELGATA